MASYTYIPKGVCATKINFDIADGRIRNVRIENGCNGNSKGIAALLEGMDADEAVKRLRGIKCGRRGTSCPDQISAAIESAKNKENGGVR